MNFGFTEEQELLRKTARDFLAEHAAMKRVREIMEGSESHCAELWGRMADLGWLGLVLPENCGGAGLTMVELAIVLEELGRCLAPVPFLPTAIAATAMLEAGDESQKQEQLAKIAAGRTRATLAITEEQGTEEPADMALSARPASDGWQLDGRKLFVCDARIADLLVVVARTGGQGAEGLGLFLVPRETPGLSIEPMQSMDLLRPLDDVAFREVRLPAAALLGGAEDAWPVIERILDRARVMICAEMVGGTEKCLEDSVRYAKERMVFGSRFWMVARVFTRRSRAGEAGRSGATAMISLMTSCRT